MTSPKLILDLQGDNIPSGQFMEAAKAFFGLLDEVASDFSGKRRPVKWAVSVEKGSVILGAQPYGYDASISVGPILTAANAGLKKLEKEPRRPRFFNDAALRHAETLSCLVDGRSLTKTSVRLRRGEETTKPISFRKTATHVASILGSTVRDYGTVEGRLKTISIKGNPYFVLYEVLTDRAIRCNIAEDGLDDAWRALRSGDRLAVSGFVSYRQTGQPVRIDVEELVPIGRGTLPSSQKIYGILTKTNVTTQS